MSHDDAPRLIKLASEPAFSLGGHEVNPSTREVIAQGRAIVVEPRVMQVLVALSRRRGQVVSRDELVLTCWDGRAVSEDAINRCIQALRRICKIDGGYSITTVSRVGYRLDEVDQSSDGPVKFSAERPRLSICVLPFSDFSEGGDQRYFSEGIGQDIVTDLSKVSSLSVVARRAFDYPGGKGADPAAVMRDAEVDYVLYGSVRKSGDDVRIAAQLVGGPAQDHLWAERWDRKFTDIFALQDEISQAVVAALKLRLLPTEKAAIGRRGTSSPEAYELYLMARQYRANGNEGDPRRERETIRLSRRATEIDPAYARAWAVLAAAQSALHAGRPNSSEDGLAAAERALTLDPNLAEAHTVKARHFANQGKHEESFAEVATAIRLDPQCWEANRLAGLLSFRRHRLGDAIRYYTAAADLMDTDFFSPMMLITCYKDRSDEIGMKTAARMTLGRAEQAVTKDKSNGAAMAMGCIALAALSRAEEARDWARRALLIDPKNMVMRYNLACAMSAHLGDAESAIRLLGEFFSIEKPFWMNHARADPDLKAIHGDPRFIAMIAQAEARTAQLAKQ